MKQYAVIPDHVYGRDKFGLVCRESEQPYFVLSSDFNAERLRADTAVAEVAALREELADRCEVIAMKGREVTETQTAVSDWARKCKAAEQRNSELLKLLGDIKRCGVYAVSISGPHIFERLDAALQPTESGASE